MKDDTISRQAAIDAIEHRLAEPAYQHTGEDWYVGMNCAESELYDLPSAQQWIPVKWHEITDTEREEEGYPKDWVVVLDSEMPYDGQKILVTTKWFGVAQDECYVDGEYALDSGWDWVDDILAWMPLPEPYRKDEEKGEAE